MEIRLFSPTETIEKKHSNLIDTDAAVFLVSAEGLYTSEKPKTDSFIGTKGYARDITELKAIKDKLRLAQFATDQGPDSLLWIDGDSRIVYANEASCTILGYTRDELLQMTVHDIDPDFTREMMIKHIEDMKKYKKMTFESRHMTKDGHIFPVEVSTNYIDYKGRFIGCAFDRDITERKRAEKVLRESLEQFRALAENSFDTIMRFDLQLRHLYVNPMAERQTGIPRDDFIGKTHRELGFDDEIVDLLENTLQKVIETGHQQRAEFKLPTNYWIDWLCIPEFDSEGQVRAIITSARDITERKTFEAQMRQAQKMESVGRLAGGVAHDFNNLIGVILGYTELAIQETSPDKPIYKNLQEINTAAERSANLTRQLLAFARKQTISPQAINPNETVESLLSMLRRLIGEDIELSWKPCENPWLIMFDPTQIDQILVNLCVNSRDAITGTGKITIETQNVTLDESYCANQPDLVPGQYLRLSISDNGCGMEKETLDKLFEPFFTTKGLSKGTGLGMATVYGIVKQNNCLINVYSEPDHGTTFNIYIPKHFGKTSRKQAKKTIMTDLKGNETVLLVEDETAILKLISSMLKHLGYNVMAVLTPGEAIHLSESHIGEIQMLITDVIMPEMNGRELVEKISIHQPHIKWLYMSGYTANVISHHGVLDPNVNFIQKPFSMKDLAVMVRSVLNDE